MKPIRLEMQAFGAYVGRQAFDFADLKGRSLFLIAGPTGSGKTTVLDAICFALYGSTSGGERKPDGMRSDYAAPDVATSVTFDFALGDKVWRVRRNLDYQRPAKRGDRPATEKANAGLWDRTGVDDPGVEGRHVASGLTEVTREVERLLGFRDDEFRQVVLIPQGRFRDLLLADSRKREEILATLFRTVRYARIEGVLKDAFLEVKRALEHRTSARDGVLQAEGAKTIEDLQAQAEAAEGARDAAGLHADTARRAKTLADAAMAEAKRVGSLLDESRLAGKALANIEARAVGVDALRIEAGRGRAAAGLRDAADEADRRKTELADRERDAAQADRQRVAAEAALGNARASLEAQQALEPEREAYARKSVLLEGLVAAVQALAAAREAATAAQRQATGSAGRAEAANAAVAARLRDVVEGRSSLERAVQQASGLEAARLAKRQADGDRQHARDLVAARGEAVAAAGEHAKAVARHGDLARQHGEAASGLERSEQALRDGAAGLLAAGLKAGEPCPVCGSATHPAPAARADDLPNPVDVARQRDHVRGLAAKVQAAADNVATLQALAAAKEARVGQIVATLGEHGDRPVQAFDAECEQADALVAAAEAASRSLDAARSAQAAREAAHARSVEDAEARAKEASDARAALEAARATLAEREAAVAPEHRDPAALDRDRKSVAARIDSLKRDLERAVEAHARAITVLASCSARCVAARDAVAEAAKLFAERGAGFSERLAAAGFQGEADFADARRTDEELAALSSRIEQFDRERAAARDRCARADVAAEGLAAPDLDGCMAAAAQAAIDLDAAVDRAGRLAQQAEHKRSLLAALRVEDEALAGLLRDHDQLGTLSGVANGTNRYNITFQRYVLAALLDSVLAAATARLGQMTSGRYLLRRVQDVGDRRRVAGLDLEVMDHYTGHARPVASLSGGESFLAALSLALGLADVVQAYSGGIRLETVFIDEGFGSLDPEALDLALRELTKLHEGGRLVGIISHVPELRQRIDARIEVTPGREGSRARIVVG